MGRPSPEFFCDVLSNISLSFDPSCFDPPTVGDLANSEFHGAFHNRPAAREGVENAFDNVANMPDQFHLQMKNITAITQSKYFIKIWSLVGGKSFNEKKAQPIIALVEAEINGAKRKSSSVQAENTEEGEAAASSKDVSSSVIEILDDIDDEALRSPFGDSASNQEDLDANGAAAALNRLYLSLDEKYQGDFVSGVTQNVDAFDSDIDHLKQALSVANVMLVQPERMLASKTMLLRMMSA